MYFHSQENVPLTANVDLRYIYGMLAIIFSKLLVRRIFVNTKISAFYVKIVKAAYLEKIDIHR